jgi:CelD/BcsL family acetyltransferase involved in cellulose biosynthesis
MLWVLRPRQEDVRGHVIPLDSYRLHARGALKEAAKKQRRLEKSHYVELKVDRGNLVAFDNLIADKRNRHAQSPLQSDEVVEFYRRLLTRGDVATMIHLLVDGQPIATQYAVAAGALFIGLVIGFDPAWHDISPGKMLMCNMLQHLETQGFSDFDSGRGDEAYKSDYGASWRPLFHAQKGRALAGSIYLHAFNSARLVSKTIRARAG